MVREFRLTVLNDKDVKVTFPDGHHTTKQLARDALRLDTIKMFHRWLSKDQVTRRCETRVLGSHLYELLFTAEIDENFQRAYAQSRTYEELLRVVIEFEREAAEHARDLVSLPWEYLYVPDGKWDREGFFISASTRMVLSRHVTVNVVAGELASIEPIRILIVTASPARDDDLGALTKIRPTKELAAIRGFAENSGFVCETLEDPTERELEAKLKPGWSVVHFIGHGRYESGEDEFLARGEVALLKDDQGTAEWLSDRKFASCFDPRPHLVILQSCKGAQSDRQRGFRGTALTLLNHGIPCVIAMQYSVHNFVAEKFSESLYEALGKKRSIEEAVQAGRYELARYLEWPDLDAEMFPAEVERTKNDERFYSTRSFGSPVIYMPKDQSVAIFAKREEKRIKMSSCPQCGKPLRNTARHCSEEDHAMVPLRACPQCGELMPAADRICTQCPSRPRDAQGGDRPQRQDQQVASVPEEPAVTSERMREARIDRAPGTGGAPGLPYRPPGGGA